MNKSNHQGSNEDQAQRDRGARSSVRRRLLLLFVGTLLVNGIALVAVGAYALRETSQTLQAKLEQTLREGLTQRSELLGRNHASALSSLVADNAFGSVRELIHSTVQHEPGVTAGFFRDTEGKVWVFSERGQPTAETGAEARWAVEAERLLPQTKRGSKGLVQVFDGRARGKEVLIARADVIVEDEQMGHLVYALSTDVIHQHLEQSRAQTRALTKKSSYLLVALGLFSIFVAVILVTRTAHKLTSPLERLRLGAQGVASGQAWKPVEVESGDELQLLADAFNHMVDHNEATMDELRRKTEEALAVARLKSEFLANMSHEIRTPMNGILGVSRLAQQRRLDGTMRRYVDTINASAQSLLTIINDVLDFSKLEAGKYTVTSVPYDPRATLTEVAQLHAGKSQEKGVRLINRVDPTVHGSLIGDPDRIRQIIGNLLSNAVKFTARGEVVMDARSVTVDDIQWLEISVTDTGAGIPKDELEQLFRAFHQVDGSLSRQHGGTGLGLAISKGLTEVMEGTIGVESTEGVGSKFTLRLPYVVDDKGSPSTDDSWTANKRVLIVEEHSLWQKILKENLEAWGFDLEIVKSGSEAEELVRHAAPGNVPFHVVIVGALRSIGALELLEELNSQEMSVALVALCEAGEETAAERIRDFGNVLSKPLHLSELYNTLQSHFLGDSRRSTGSYRTVELRSALPVLVVDDNETNRFVASEQLASLGLDCDTADNGLIAFEKVKEGKYLAILMDCQMPVMDGYTATRAIRQWESENEEPTNTIIALTAHAMAGERERVKEAGMDDYLAKPAQESTLARMLMRHAGPELESKAGKKKAKRVSMAPPAIDPVLSADVPRSKQFIEIFERNFREQVRSVEEGLQSENKEEVPACAHKLKGTLSAFGAMRAHKTAVELDLAAKAGDWEKSYELLVKLDVEGAAIEAELERVR